MNVLIAYASADDQMFFSRELDGHTVTYSEGIACQSPETLEALSIVHGQPLPADHIANFPNLKLIVTRSTGFDHIDVATARQRGITVCNVPEYGSTTVAEFTFGLILSLTRNIPAAVAQSREGRFSVDGLGGIDLEGKTLGIIGLGKIGRSLARMASGFRMNVIAFDPFKPDTTPLDELLATSDVVALCCPLTPQTYHLINATTLSQMKPGAKLVNTARGGVIDAEALLSALDNGHLTGAALDVLEDETAPGDTSQKLMSHPRVLVTPHLAFDTRETRDRIRATTAETIREFANGRRINEIP